MGNLTSIIFKNRQHENFYNEYLEKCRYKDVYHKTLVYCLGENRKNLYQSMLLTGKLNRHLQETEEAAQERLETLVKGLLERYPAPDKAVDQMKWAAHMNSLKAMAEESILEDLVYT